MADLPIRSWMGNFTDLSKLSDLCMTSAHHQQIAARKKARHYAVQALYQWHMADAEPAQIEAEFRTDYDMTRVDDEYFHELLFGVVGSEGRLRALFEPILDRNYQDLDAVELALLRVGAFELSQRLDIPYKVVINESVSLAKKFGATDSHKYINGILDKLAAQLREPEVSRGQPGVS